MSTPDRLTGEEREARGVHCSDCGHRLIWHHDERGCGYHGHGRDRCPCLLTSDDAARLAAQPPATDRDALADAARRAIEDGDPGEDDWFDLPRADFVGTKWASFASAYPVEAAYIVAADPRIVLRLLAARPAPDTLADRVQALHQPIEVYAYDEVNGAWQTGEDGEKVLLATFCRECSSDDVVSAIEDVEWHEDWFGYGEVAYPCATVALLAGRSDASPEGGA